MAHEKLSSADPKPALASYRKAIPLLTIAESEISVFPPSTVPPTSSSGVGKIDFHSFTRFRELWRWVERLIWRAIILTSRSCDINDDSQEDSVWTWFAHYMACSAHWPPTFRCHHRSMISVLHLQALILRAKSSHPVPSPTPQSTTPPPAHHFVRRSPLWVQTARSVVQEYRAILTVSTRFPRAGERNVKVENFVDLCVAVWEASGEVSDSTGWVIDVSHLVMHDLWMIIALAHLLPRYCGGRHVSHSTRIGYSDT